MINYLYTLHSVFFLHSPFIGQSSNVSIVALGKTEATSSSWLFVVDTDIITGNSLGALDLYIDNFHFIISPTLLYIVESSKLSIGGGRGVEEGVEPSSQPYQAIHRKFRDIPWIFTRYTQFEAQFTPHWTLDTFGHYLSIGDPSNVSIVALGRREAATSHRILTGDTNIITAIL